ncbi:MAG: sodium/proline symporter [Mobilitalea sp.]
MRYFNSYFFNCRSVFVIIYTFLGGFLAESASDFMQAIVMIIALVIVLVASIIYAGGLGAIFDNLQKIPGFLDFFGISSPEMKDGVQQLSQSGAPIFGEAKTYGFLTILSTLSWGLGYFGMPQVLLRFMAIRSHREIAKSRRIATTWCSISLFAAVFIGLIGRTAFPAEHLTSGGAEKIFITLSTNLMPTIIAGMVMAGILAATISSSDSYLLIASSAVSKNIFQGLIKKNATDKEVMTVARIILVAISLIGIIIALDKNSVIFTVVAFAWAGFGATFGPIMLFSLFWKRTTREGAIAGMLSGGLMVFFWRLIIKPMGGILGIYELLPAFLFSCIIILVVSLSTKEPDQEMLKEFELAKSYKD